MSPFCRKVTLTGCTRSIRVLLQKKERKKGIYLHCFFFRFTFIFIFFGLKKYKMTVGILLLTNKKFNAV